MTRRLQMVLAGAVGAVLCGAALGHAATEQQLFFGEVDEQPDATVRMKTGATREFHVKVFTARDFTADCDAGDGIIERATLKGRIPVGARGRFHVRDDNGETVLNVRGEIDGRNAEGVFRFSGELEDEDGATQECDSGRLEWSAHSPAT